MIMEEKKKEGVSVDETEVAVKLEVHEHEIGTLKYRIRSLEAQSKFVQEFAISINKIKKSRQCLQPIRELNLIFISSREQKSGIFYKTKKSVLYEQTFCLN